MADNPKTYNVLDLFCGCGGLSLGFEFSGYNIIAGIDVWEDALDTYNYNHKKSKAICADLSTLLPNEVEKLIPDINVDVIVGGPPCQGFSLAGKRMLNRLKICNNTIKVHLGEI